MPQVICQWRWTIFCLKMCIVKNSLSSNQEKHVEQLEPKLFLIDDRNPVKLFDSVFMLARLIFMFLSFPSISFNAILCV